MYNSLCQNQSKFDPLEKCSSKQTFCRSGLMGDDSLCLSKPSNGSRINLAVDNPPIRQFNFLSTLQGKIPSDKVLGVQAEIAIKAGIDNQMDSKSIFTEDNAGRATLFDVTDKSHGIDEVYLREEAARYPIRTK